MGLADHIDFDLFQSIEELADRGDLERSSAAYGIALRRIDYGYDSLTERQRYVYDRDVVPLLRELAEEEAMAWSYDPS